MLLTSALSLDNQHQSHQPPTTADSLSEHQFRQQLSEVSAKADRIARQHQISEPWAQQDLQYQQAALQRKCYWVHRLQNSIAAEVDQLHVLKLSAEQTSRQNRGTSSSFKRQVRATRIRIEKSIMQLQHWHVVSGDIGSVTYDPSLLTVANMEEQNWSVPWYTNGLAQSALQEQITDVQQRIVRCSEEQDIVAREAKDAVAFYQHKVQSLQTAIQAREASEHPVISSPAWQSFSQSLMDSSPELVEREYVAGQLHVLQEQKQISQHLLMQMQSVIEQLAGSVIDESHVVEQSATVNPGSLMHSQQGVHDDDMLQFISGYDLDHDDDVSSTGDLADMYEYDDNMM